MENNLTVQQQQAVDNRGGKLLVSAAAGSGKTKVLVDRLMGFILDESAPSNIDDFLIITYTKAAAAELRGKIAARLSEYLSEYPNNQHLRRQMQRLYLAKISTVHSFCSDLLREYANQLDLPGDFRVAEENECRQIRLETMTELLDRAYRDQKDNPSFYAFINTQGLGKDDRAVPDIIQKVYDSARCHLNPEQWLDYCVSSADLKSVTDAADTVWGNYLLNDLKEYLKLQIHAMEQCAHLAAEDALMEKPQALLEKTVNDLRFLADAKSWNEVVQRRQIDYGRLVFSKKITDQDLVQKIKAVRENCKKGLEKRLKIFCDPSEQVLSDLHQTGQAILGLTELTRAFAKSYEQTKRKKRVLDFSDLEHKTLDLLLGKSRQYPTGIAGEIGCRFREVLVDEYQDSNEVQDSIFSALTEKKQNCFMVGDVKQSIYRFRLADPGIFLRKYHDYRPADQAQPGEGRKVILSKNFRSGGAVLEAANDVFYRCMSTRTGGLDYGPDEALEEGIAHDALGEPEVQLHVLETGESGTAEEAEFVAASIAELLSGTHPVRGKDGLRAAIPEDVAILLRSPGSVGSIYQNALSKRGIPSSFGGGRDLLQTGEISALRSLLQIISNPRQDVALTAALMSPVYGFTADDLARIRSRQKNGDLYDALKMDDQEQTTLFLRNLEELRFAARIKNLAELLEEIFCLTKIDSIYAAMESGVERTENLRAFFQIAVGFERSSRKNLDQFLDYLSAMEEKGLTVGDEGTGGTVQILSIHKSKGLEYPVVFLSSLSRSFNTDSLRAPVLCDGKLGLGLSAVDDAARVRYPTIAKRAIVAHEAKEGLSEELRVLYVAMTRARDRLIMTYAGKTAVKDLQRIANQIDIGGTRLLAGDVSCPGQWILMEAMCRTEAGALFEACECRPSHLHTPEFPWEIQLHNQECTHEELSYGKYQNLELPQTAPELLEQLNAHLGYTYPHGAATHMPSKQTATQLKGRDKDEEIAQGTQMTVKPRQWRPFSCQTHGKGTEYGKAMHSLMQYVKFEHCNNTEALENDISRLVEKKLITEEQGNKIDRDGVISFFRTDLGKRISRGQVLREFKFSILDDASKYGDNLEGEQVLLQGVVDCALVEPDGITVVDFKTDYVTEEDIEAIKSRYSAQVRAYADALSRIYEQPIKASYLYSFHLQKLIPV